MEKVRKPLFCITARRILILWINVIGMKSVHNRDGLHLHRKMIIKKRTKVLLPLSVIIFFCRLLKYLQIVKYGKNHTDKEVKTHKTAYQTDDCADNGN